jgi:asparagine synthase (glutamine-hydrolysing)
MCGLVGYIGATPPVDRAGLEAMRDTLARRGPDGAGLYTHADADIAVGLGFRRLSIIDTRAVGLQPMHNEDEQLTLVFNGEIYNFAALRQELEATGRHTFRTRTDTEVILHLYEECGPAVVERLEGMFAFALWDARERQLLLARDRMGKKPLHYGVDAAGRLIFGSEIKALMASGRLPDTLDLQAHHDYLALNYVPGEQTMFAAVRKLPPAHALLWKDGRMRTWRYWDVRFHSETTPPARAPGEGEAARQTLDLLRSAVRDRLVSDVPLGMFLSGGIDSSAVLMCMAEASPRPVEAFTIRFEEASYDESKQAARVAKQFGAHHHVETVRPEAGTFLSPLVDALDEPYADSSAIPLWYLARLARRHVTVALGGDGGDELYAGYRTHKALRIAQLWRRLPATLRETVAPALIARLPVSHRKVSFDLKARQFVRAASLPPPDAHYGYKEFLDEDARRALTRLDTDASTVEPTVRLWRAACAAHPFGDPLDAILYSDLQLYLPDDILVKVDRITMAHSLEARSPFLDRRLVEHAASLPGRYKLLGTRTKHLLKRALWGKLPLSILERGKAGFNVPMATWLNGDLRTLLRDTLSSTRVQAMGLWSPPAVSRMIEAHARKERDHSRTLWALLCFAAWNDRHRGGRSL